MTSAPPPFENDDADLLASLYLDGEATAEEVALVESSPELLARVDAFRSTRAAVANVGAPPADLKRRQIEAALVAAPWLTPVEHTGADASPLAAAASTAASDGTAVADELGRARAARQARRGIPAWLGAAAASVVVVGGVGFALANLSQSSDDDTSDAASPAIEESARNGQEAFSTDDSDAGDASESPTVAAAPEALDSSAADAAMSDEDDGAADDGAMEESDAMEEEAADEEAADEEALFPAIVPFVGGIDGRSALEIADPIPSEAFAPVIEAACFDQLAADSPIRDDAEAMVALIELDNGEFAELILFTAESAGGLEPAALILDASCAILAE